VFVFILEVNGSIVNFSPIIFLMHHAGSAWCSQKVFGEKVLSRLWVKGQAQLLWIHVFALDITHG